MQSTHVFSSALHEIFSLLLCIFPARKTYTRTIILGFLMIRPSGTYSQLCTNGLPNGSSSIREYIFLHPTWMPIVTNMFHGILILDLWLQTLMECFFFYYAFPSFSLISRVFAKVRQDQACIAPVGTIQVWFSTSTKSSSGTRYSQALTLGKMD